MHEQFCHCSAQTMIFLPEFTYLYAKIHKTMPPLKYQYKLIDTAKIYIYKTRCTSDYRLLHKRPRTHL